MPIPFTSLCRIDHLIVSWPKYNGRNCFCPLNKENRYFDNCVENCETEQQVSLAGNFILINNFSSYKNEALVHFICEKDPCFGDKSCHLETITATYKISFISKFL